jgi:hypothetical protein
MEILGGRRSAFDAAFPTAVFVACLLVLDRVAPSARVSGAVAGGVLAGVAVAGWRWARERRPRAAVLGLVPVLAGAALVARTGRAEDFFLVRIAANALSAIAWAASVWIGRPLLGVVVGVVLRQRGAWRRDPDLLAGYSRASWWWAGSFALRTVVFTGFWAAGHAVVLGVAQVALSWPLTTAVLLLSWRTLRGSLPAGHPGLRHPRPTDPPAGRPARPAETQATEPA